MVKKNRCSLGFHASFHETKKWAGTEAVEVCVIRRVVEQVQGCDRAGAGLCVAGQV